MARDDDGGGGVVPTFAMVAVGTATATPWNTDVLGKDTADILTGLHDHPLFAELFVGVVSFRACSVLLATETEGGEDSEVQLLLGDTTPVGNVKNRKVTVEHGKAYVHIRVVLPYVAAAGGGGGSGGGAHHTPATTGTRYQQQLFPTTRRRQRQVWLRQHLRPQRQQQGL